MFCLLIHEQSSDEIFRESIRQLKIDHAQRDIAFQDE